MKKRNDKILIFGVIAVAFLLAVVISAFLRFENRVEIRQDNKIVYSGSLFTDKTVELSHNTIVIEKGCVNVRSADCKNQICVKHKKIERAGESIICLPNRVIVEIK